MSDVPDRRRRVVALAKRTAPLAYVRPPISALLDDTQAVIATALARLAEVVRDPEHPITSDQAKALQALANTLVSTEKAKKEFNEAAVGDLTDDELREMLMQELEAETSKKST